MASWTPAKCRILPVIALGLCVLFGQVRSMPTGCQNEDCLFEPVVGDPDRTLPPLPTPKTQKPSIDSVGGGLVQEVSCGNPGSSSSARGSCGASDEARDIRIKNIGRIDIILFFIQPDGSQQRSFLLRPGAVEKIAPTTCVGHRWMIRSVCGDCMAVIRVSSPASELVEISNESSETSCPGPRGKWTAPRQWQNRVVAAGLANVPGTDNVLGFSSVQEGSYNRRKPAVNPLPPARKTQAALFNYKTNAFTEKDLIGHNMFCAAITLLPDGKLFAQGGGDGPDARFVSTYNPFQGANGQWNRHGDTANGHWYGTVIVTAQQNLLLALGVDKVSPGFTSWASQLNFPERSQGFDFSKRWTNMTGIDLDGKQPDVKHWYPMMHLMPNGDILESGTMNNMWKIRTTGAGSISFAGKRNKAREEKEAWGASTIMYDEGKLLTIGGIENFGAQGGPRTVYKRAIAIDMNNPNNVKTRRTDDLSYRRAFVNTVVLPSGEVVAIGGKNNFKQWDDTFSAKAAELWNPETDKWTILAEHQKPRNYHAAAILLRDGRVLSAGGGLCPTCDRVENGNRLNQPTHEILSPPYLFNDAGGLKTRPIIRNSPGTTGTGRRIRIVVTGPRSPFINRVSVVKQSSVTHTISTDARQLQLPIIRTIRQSDTRYVYVVKAHGNKNVMTPGYWFLFVLDDTGTPSVAKDLRMVT